MSVRLPQRPRQRARSRVRSRGQGLVEFALLAPVLLLILLFAIDFGRALYGWVVLQNSARIAANYAALNPDGWRDNDAGVKAGYQVQIHDDLQAVGYCVPAGYVAPDPVFTDGPDTADAAGPNDSVYDVGDTVTVALTCDFAPLTPIITFITGATVELGASSEFRIRAGDVAGLPHSTRIPPPPTPAPSGSGSPSSPPSAPPSVPPSSPACLTVPDLVLNGGTPQTVGQARTEWQAAGFTGQFLPNGQNGRTVLSQSVLAGSCVPASTAVTVTHS